MATVGQGNTAGLTQYMTAVQVSGQYPEWTLTVEDAVGAPQ
jgi:hypothetical protein